MDTTQILQIIGGLATGLVGVFVGKGVERAKAKKVEAETDSINISSTERAINIWEDLNRKLHEELESLRTQVFKIQREYDEIKKENKKLHEENSQLSGKIGILEREVERLTQLSQ